VRSAQAALHALSVYTRYPNRVALHLRGAFLLGLLVARGCRAHCCEMANLVSRKYCFKALPFPDSRSRLIRPFPSCTSVGIGRYPRHERTVCNGRCSGLQPLRATTVPDVSAFISQNGSTLGWIAAVAVAFVTLFKLLQQGSRKYDGNVGDEYDAWTREGILEHYWGEHIHLGYYTDEERQPGFFAWGKKDFKQVSSSTCLSARSRCAIQLRVIVCTMSTRCLS
jgi:hypothetical protein